MPTYILNELMSQLLVQQYVALIYTCHSEQAGKKSSINSWYISKERHFAPVCGSLLDFQKGQEVVIRDQSCMALYSLLSTPFFLHLNIFHKKEIPPWFPRHSRSHFPVLVFTEVPADGIYCLLLSFSSIQYQGGLPALLLLCPSFTRRN